MADILSFDPATEFEIIESIDFEEEIQRPEELRFFTLEEQLLDYFDKVLPKKKHISKFEYMAIAEEISRIRDLYNRIVIITDADYQIDLSRKTINVSWVNPIHSEFEYAPYSFKERWIPLFDEAAYSRPNYYPIMLSGLPKPYKTTGSGTLIDKSEILVDELGGEEIRALSIYKRTKSVNHEDGSVTVVSIPVANTEDDMKSKGFFIGNRGLEIPNPLADHPFLSSNKAHPLLTEQPLAEVFPTVEAILTHGVPVTKDPYVEGLKFLKVYDIRLRDIPWNLWKDKFPPEDTITAHKKVMSVEFPNDRSEPSPSKTLQETYVIPWSSGLHPRLWLMEQEDGGQLVVKMVLSKSSVAGLVPPQPFGEKLDAIFPSSTPLDCLTTTTFDAFLTSGLYRKGFCIPTSFITQERASYMLANKIAWKESTEFDILQEHQKLLKLFQHSDMAVVAPVYEKYTGQPESELRREVRAILNDVHRVAVDKADSIQKIVTDLQITNNLYLDSSDSFVICSHTLAELEGDLIADRLGFYESWTAIDEGFRSCRFCGEQINADVLVAQDEFDENGGVIKSFSSLEVRSAPDEHGPSFTNSLLEMKKFFLLDNAGEATVYLLLSLLQVLPTESQLTPIVQNVREISSVLRKTKAKAEDKDRIEGILGLAAMVTLLQTHNPFLIPRRSFGSKILKLSGYPRDTTDSADSPVLDVLLSILKTTFEGTANTFKGPTAALFRGILTKPKDIRKEAVKFLAQTFKKFETQYESAKQRYSVAPEPEVVSQLLLPVIVVEKTVFAPYEKLGEEEITGTCTIPTPHVSLTGRLHPSVRQDPLELWKNIKQSAHATDIYVEFKEPKMVTFTDAEIRKRMGLGFPKIKIEKLETFLKSDTDGIAFLALLNRLLDVIKLPEYREASVFLETRINKSLLRDAARGLVYEVLHEIKDNQATVNTISALVQKDLTMNMIILTYDDATRQDLELRAKERETFKARMRSMNDSARQITKMLLDIGLAPHVITNEDREFFAQEYKYPDPETEYDELVKEIPSEDKPDEGFNAARDAVDGEEPLGETGVPLENDYGDYGDRRTRGEDEDYSGTVDDGNGFGA